MAERRVSMVEVPSLPLPSSFPHVSFSLSSTPKPPLPSLSLASDSADDADLSSPHLPLFTSPLLPHSDPSPHRRPRPRPSHPSTLKSSRTPRSLKPRSYTSSSPFQVDESLPYLSLLPPSSSPRASFVAGVTAPPAPPPSSAAFLSPLLRVSSEGLTVRPPTLNWSVASRVLEAASEASYELVASSALCEVDKEAAVDRLLSLHLQLDVDGLSRDGRRVEATAWDSRGALDYARLEQQYAADREMARAFLQQQRDSLQAQHVATITALARSFHHLNAEEEDDRRARYSRHLRQRAYQNALHRIDDHRQAETARWSLAWARASALHAQRRERDLAERALRAHADALRADALWHERRAKAKMARVELRVVRLELTDAHIVPPATHPFFVCQVMQAAPLVGGLDYPTPLTELRFSPFLLARSGSEGKDEEGEEYPVEWRCEFMVKNVSSALLVLACQASDPDQTARWLRKQARLRAKRDERLQAVHDTTPVPPPRKGRKAATVTTKGKRPSPAKAAGSEKRKKGASAQPARQMFKPKRAKDLSNHPARHLTITRVVEVGRVEYRLKALRDESQGDVRVRLDLCGECWYAKRDKLDKRRRKAAQEPSDLAAPSPRPSTDEWATSPRPAPMSPLSPSSVSARRLPLHPALTVNPALLYPPAYRPHRSALQLLLMTEKERQHWVEEEERKERLRRERDEKERLRWTQRVGYVWVDVRLVPYDADGREIVREGVDEREEVNEDDDAEDDVDDYAEEEEAGEADGIEGKEETGEETEALNSPSPVRSSVRKSQSKAVRPQPSATVPSAAVRGKTFPLLD